MLIFNFILYKLYELLLKFNTINLLLIYYKYKNKNKNKKKINLI